MKVRFKRVYKNFSIGDKVNIDKKEELDYLINTKTVDILENFVTSELEEEKTVGNKANIDKKEELDYLINTKTVDILENFVTSELEEEKTVDKTESPKEKSNSKGKSKK